MRFLTILATAALFFSSAALAQNVTSVNPPVPSPPVVDPPVPSPPVPPPVVTSPPVVPPPPVVTSATQPPAVRPTPITTSAQSVQPRPTINPGAQTSNNSQDGANKTAIIVGSVIGAICVLALASFTYHKCKGRDEEPGNVFESTPPFLPNNKPQTPPKETTMNDRSSLLPTSAPAVTTSSVYAQQYAAMASQMAAYMDPNQAVTTSAGTQQGYYPYYMPVTTAFDPNTNSYTYVVDQSQAAAYGNAYNTQQSQAAAYGNAYNTAAYSGAYMVDPRYMQAAAQQQSQQMVANPATAQVVMKDRPAGTPA